MKKIILLSIIILLFGCTSNNSKKKGTWIEKETSDKNFKIYTDSRDSNTYKSVKIGNQEWMAENLRNKADSGCWAYNDDESNAKKYGYLYDWETAIKVCPAGWHLPTDAEWKTLTTYLGDESIAGGKLKSTIGWDSPNTGATNSSGFTALPCGYRSDDGAFSHVGSNGFWWSSTEDDANNAWTRFTGCNYSDVNRYYIGKANGFSVRCVRDK